MRSGPAWAETAAKTEPVSQRVVAREAPVRAARSLTKAQPVSGCGVGDLRGQDACGLQGQTGGEIDALVAGQLTSQPRQDQADGFVGPLAGGVGAFVADLLQHLLVRRPVRPLVLKRYAHVGDHCGACLSWK